MEGNEYLPRILEQWEQAKRGSTHWEIEAGFNDKVINGLMNSENEDEAYEKLIVTIEVLEDKFKK